MSKFLTAEQEIELRALHRKERDRRIADRIKAVLLSNQGWTYLMISQALLLDDQTISQYVEDYKTKYKLKHESGGSESKLTKADAKVLEAHLEANLYVNIKQICAYVEKTFEVKYTVAGMQSWMKNHNFVYKKPKGIPAKANTIQQEEFIEKYRKLVDETPANEPILFGDSAHPTQSTKLAYGWIKKGKDHHIPTTGQRTRVNITGAINLLKNEVFACEFDKINSSNFIEFLKILGASYPEAPHIHLIVDNGPAHKSKEVMAYIEQNPKIKLHFLPAYSPNLNPIERLWKIMHEYISNNQYYATAKAFKSAVQEFFQHTIGDIKDIIKNRITDNFAVLYT